MEGKIQRRKRKGDQNAATHKLFVHLKELQVWRDPHSLRQHIAMSIQGTWADLDFEREGAARENKKGFQCCEMADWTREGGLRD